LTCPNLRSAVIDMGNGHLNHQDKDNLSEQVAVNMIFGASPNLKELSFISTKTWVKHASRRFLAEWNIVDRRWVDLAAFYKRQDESRQRQGSLTSLTLQRR
jgi:hypothetical protein